MHATMTEQSGAERGGDAPNRLAEDHLYLVQHAVNQVASRYPRHVDREELWNAGAHGLVEASRRYDPATGVPFGRYAMIRIRGAIIDATRTRDWATRRLRRELRDVERHSAAFEERHGRAPSSEELAAELGIGVAELEQRRAAAMTAHLLHLDQPLADAETGEDTRLVDRVPEGDTRRIPHDALEDREVVGTVYTAIRHLPDVQRDVVVRHFFNDELLRDIAASLGVTEARVSQIRSEALNAIRAYFATAFEGVVPVPDGAPGQRRRASYVASVSANSTWRSRLDGVTSLAGAVPAGGA